jgi:geranylgeranyl pyrophosphate synthase
MLPIDFSERFEAALGSYYDEKGGLFQEAILYSLLGPGKRLRPQLAYICALAADSKTSEEVWQLVLPAMRAVEMVHCYSLVHDDLPAMDNDDYRRGRLSCHKKFSEATAILVGDALIADAFDVLSTSKYNVGQQMQELARAIGSRGMVLGQQRDLAATTSDTTWEQWNAIHALKTGRLFECACVMGGLSVDAPVHVVEELREFARSFGIAFQLRDDLIDNASTVRELGRPFIETLLQQNVDAAVRVAGALKSEALESIARRLLGDFTR